MPKLQEARERVLRLFYQTWAQGERWNVLEEFLDELIPFTEEDWKVILRPTMDALVQIGKRAGMALAASVLFDLDGDGVPDLLRHLCGGASWF